MAGLNIISFDVPYPPDYGGIIDVFYKIKALHAKGIDIYLHSFKYRTDKRDRLLDQYCKKIFYYKRKTGTLNHISLLPYIIYSRRDKALLSNLNSNSYPILFEGIHTTYYLLKGKFKDRPLLLRSHNVEHDYYKYIAKREKNLFKKIFFYKEALLLKAVLRRVPKNLIIGAISLSDQDYLKKKFKNTFWLPPFHSNRTVTCIQGFGKYALYHGNLSVSENSQAAAYLITLFANKEVELIIAGKAPSGNFLNLVRGKKNIKIVPNPSARVMEDLIQHAHVILLPTFQPTGIKLKLIESLHKGRYCIANSMMFDNTMLEDAVIKTEKDFYNKTFNFMQKEFSQAQIIQRTKLLQDYFNNDKHAELIIKKLN